MSNLRPSIFCSWARARLWSSLILAEFVMYYSPTTLTTINISSLGKTVIMVEFIWTKIVWGGFVMANSLTTLTIMAWATLSFELVHNFMTINMLSLGGRVIMVGFIMDETCLGEFVMSTCSLLYDHQYFILWRQRDYGRFYYERNLAWTKLVWSTTDSTLTTFNVMSFYDYGQVFFLIYK